MRKKIFIGFLLEESFKERDLSFYSITNRDQKEYLGIFLLNQPNFQEIQQAKKRLLASFSPSIQEKDLFVFSQILLG